MSAGVVITAALHAMQGTVGELTLVLECRRPVNKPQVLRWITRLRKAADTLEELLK